MFFSQPLHFVTHTLTNLIPFMPYTPSLGSNGSYSSVLGIHFTIRVAPTMVRREHNNRVSKFQVDIDGETENTTPLSPPEKSGSDTIKEEGDTALEAEAQLYSNNIV